MMGPPTPYDLYMGLHVQAGTESASKRRELSFVLLKIHKPFPRETQKDLCLFPHHYLCSSLSVRRLTPSQFLSPCSPKLCPVFSHPAPPDCVQFFLTLLPQIVPSFFLSLLLQIVSTPTTSMQLHLSLGLLVTGDACLPFPGSTRLQRAHGCRETNLRAARCPRSFRGARWTTGTSRTVPRNRPRRGPIWANATGDAAASPSTTAVSSAAAVAPADTAAAATDAAAATTADAAAAASADAAAAASADAAAAAASADATAATTADATAAADVVAGAGWSPAARVPVRCVC